jgi:hypothetical protein
MPQRGEEKVAMDIEKSRRKEKSERSAGLGRSATWAKRKMRPKEKIERREEKKGCHCGLIHVDCLGLSTQMVSFIFFV